MSMRKENKAKSKITNKINNMKHHGASKLNDRLGSCLADSLFMSPTW